jgi:hypothetical protein
MSVLKATSVIEPTSSLLVNTADHLDTGNKGRTGSVMSREDWDVYQERAKKR